LFAQLSKTEVRNQDDDKDDENKDDDDEGNHLSKALSHLARVGMHGLVPADLLKTLPADKMEPAITIMADVRAYFQGSSSPYRDSFIMLMGVAY